VRLVVTLDSNFFLRQRFERPSTSDRHASAATPLLAEIATAICSLRRLEQAPATAHRFGKLMTLRSFGIWRRASSLPQLFHQ